MKEYRVRQQIMEGPHKGEWGCAWHPNGGRVVHAYSTLEDAQNWISAQPTWYEKYNKMWPPEFRKEVPPYKIEVREVSPWEEVEL